MKLYLITLGHEHDEGTVVTPIVVPAEDDYHAECLANEISERMGIELWDEPVEIGRR